MPGGEERGAQQSYSQQVGGGRTVTSATCSARASDSSAFWTASDVWDSTPGVGGGESIVKQLGVTPHRALRGRGRLRLPGGRYATKPPDRVAVMTDARCPVRGRSTCDASAGAHVAREASLSRRELCPPCARDTTAPAGGRFDTRRRGDRLTAFTERHSCVLGWRTRWMTVPQEGRPRSRVSRARLLLSSRLLLGRRLLLAAAVR